MFAEFNNLISQVLFQYNFCKFIILFSEKQMDTTN